MSKCETKSAKVKINVALNCSFPINSNFQQNLLYENRQCSLLKMNKDSFQQKKFNSLFRGGLRLCFLMCGVRGHDEAGFRTSCPCDGVVPGPGSRVRVIVMCNEGLSGDWAQWKQPQQGFNMVQIGN